MKPDISIDLAGTRLRSPVVTASGCFASGREISELADLRKIGAVVVKSMTIDPWPGKSTPRMAETASGMLNAIGLQNKGVGHFLAEDLPWLRSRRIPAIASIAGNTVQEFIAVAEWLRGAQGLVAIEINISCPNLEDRNNMFAHDASATSSVIAAVRRVSEFPVFAKLSPNVTDITKIAGAALEAGAHGLSLINTLVGMSIDIDAARPKLASIVGGLSGPAIKPVALRALFEVHQAFPDALLIGMGGIMDERDAIEFIMGGATAVAIGTANFIDPLATVKVSDGIERLMEERGYRTLDEIRGSVKVD